DQLASGLTSPLISKVITPAAMMPSPADLRALSTFAPQLLDAGSYRALEPRLTDEGVDQALKAMRRTLMSPQSVAMADWFRSDPLGARATALKPLEAMGKSMNYRMSIRDGHFFSEDLSTAMLILETPVRITDHAGSAELIAFIRGRLDLLPSGLKHSIIAGHLHTLSNQRVIRRDINWTGTLATIFFVALFLLCFRDARSVIIFVIPPLGILMGLAAVALSGMQIAAVALGMGSVLAGIAIDYGIHAYVALSFPETVRTRWEAVRLIRSPLILSTLTTITPLACLLFSTIPGYRQLGLLASCTLVFSLILALRAMPLFFPETVRPAPPKPAADRPVRRRLSAPRAMGLYLALLAGGLLAASGLRMDFDFTRLDGTEQDILSDEQSFFQRWGTGQGSMDMLAVWDADPEKARQANDLLYERMRTGPGATTSLLSLAAVWPSEKTRREHAALWLDFWSQQAAPLRERVARLSPAYGFSTNAFDPFFQSLREGTDPALFAPGNKLMATLDEQFTRSDDGRFMILSFSADNPALAEALRAKQEVPAEYLYVSRGALQQEFSTFIIRDLSRQALIGLTSMGLLVLLMVRKLRAILLIGIPPVTGVVGMMAGFRLLGQPLTPVSILTALMLVGICIDYGVFMLEAWQRGSRDTILRGLNMAWLTTAGGAALLLVAQHPVLYTTGLTLSIGVTCGYASARWVVWPIAEVLRVPSRKKEGA
ncbi:MAG: hypothetical protein V2A34_15455, partial [Lentisphaerota bacterium]